jgi:hypothetical protein
MLRWDQARWEIEDYVRSLKQGGQSETLRLEAPERVERCLALYPLSAWRLHPLPPLARAYPHAPGSIVFEAKEWRTIYLLHPYKRPPQKPPPLRMRTRMVAPRGGFLARKGDGEPGVETGWRGDMEIRRAVPTLALAKAAGV